MAELEIVTPLVLRQRDAETAVASTELFQSMLKAGWIEPIISRGHTKLFLVDDIRTALVRLRREKLSVWVTSRGEREI